MAPSLPSFAFLLAVLAGLAAPPAAAQTRPRQELPIALDAASSDFDYKNNSLRFRQVKLSQGVLRVEAAEALATGLNFDNSRWTFRGQVRISTADGTLISDDATVDFLKNELSRAVITGGPATFEQRRPPARAGEAARVVQGRAGRIEYDLGAGTVRLVGNAWLSESGREISAGTMVYGLKDQRVLANPDAQNTGRVSITIPAPATPSTTSPANTPQNKPAAPTPAPSEAPGKPISTTIPPKGRE